jgi:2-keto-4-pentenoate hydratase/2-oxohepta-3-ene-1,7-dioic acid hydratase in catechol pathway
MKIAKFVYNGVPAWGLVDGPELVVFKGHPLFNNYETSGDRLALKDVQLLPPVLPTTKILCIGKNYEDHAIEMGLGIPTEPLIFFKPTSALIGPEESIVIPTAISTDIDPEGELVIVIGQLAKNVSEEDAMDYVWGFTIGNDVSARDIQTRDGQWARAKGFDTFCPLGPWIETEFEPEGQLIETRVNGETRQSSATNKMMFDIPRIIQHVTAAMTLLPGDVIFTGTPAGIQNIVPGDVVEVEVEGIGVLRNPVA